MWVHSVNLVLYIVYLALLTLLATKDFTSHTPLPNNSTLNSTQITGTKSDEVNTQSLQNSLHYLIIKLMKFIKLIKYVFNYHVYENIILNNSQF